MLKMFKKYLRNESGASAVEFALISPILIFMLIGTVDFGFFITERMQLQNTAHAAADYVAQVQDDANVQIVAEESYGAGFEDITLTSEFLCECSDGVEAACPVSCGDDDYQRRFISIAASGTFEPIFPYPGLPTDMPLQSTVRMRVD